MKHIDKYFRNEQSYTGSIKAGRKLSNQKNLYLQFNNFLYLIYDINAFLLDKII